MDVLLAFLDDCCLIHSTAKVRASSLYRAYTEWCDKSGENAENQRRFGQRLTEQRNFEKYSNDGVWYRGIGLAERRFTEPTEPTEPEKAKVSAPPNLAGKSGKVGSVGSVGSVDSPPLVESDPPLKPLPPMVCRWGAMDRLVTRCDNPEPNDDRTGCANCGSLKP